MTERRHYPPAVFIHVPHCKEGQDKPALATASVSSVLPNYQLHFCFEEFMLKPITEIAAMGVIPMVTWETPDYGRHPYDPDRSGRSPLPPDAIDYPCKVCRSTHGRELEEFLGVPPGP